MPILLADDHRRLLELTRGLLEPIFDVVGCGGGGKSPVEADGKLQPDVIVTDISLPKLTGIEAADRLTESGSSRLAWMRADIRSNKRRPMDLLGPGMRLAVRQSKVPIH